MKRTFETDKHYFYMGFFKAVGSGQRQVLYNIVPKDQERPKTGYYRPTEIIKLKGYNYKVSEVFPSDPPTEDAV